MARLQLSVAICTYNGAPYLTEQLESIARQSRLPDEVVICDDGSTDKTKDIVCSFRPDLPFPLRFEENPQRLGTTKNFEQAIQLCQGEVIVLSDQDDVWLPHRLEETESLFLQRPQTALLFGNALMVDGNLRPLGYSLWKSIGFTAFEQYRFNRHRAFDILIRHNVVTGATMAFRASFRDLILPIPSIWIHDGWIALVIATVADIATVPIPLILYRQHSANQLGAARRSPYSKWITRESSVPSPYAAYCEQLEILHAKLKALSVTRQRHFNACIAAKVRHLNFRKALPPRRMNRLPSIAREILTGRYFRFSNGFQSALKDLMLSEP